ncbi:MAG: hypothetical protein QOH39_2507 [Verrucomicrobiota bacterium]|jgi:hypothetical protein
MRSKSAIFAILVGGSIAGVLDITYAIVFSSFRGVRMICRASVPDASSSSGVSQKRPTISGPLVLATGLFMHMFFISLPISLAVRRAAARV